MTRREMKQVENYSRALERDMAIQGNGKLSEDEVLMVLNTTPKLNTRANRIARKRKAKEHDLEIVFFGKKVKK